MAIATVVVMLPILFPNTWNKQLADLDHLPHPVVNHPRMLALGGLIVGLGLVLFVVGESLPVPISLAAIALLGAALRLLLTHHSGLDTVHNILCDVG